MGSMGFTASLAFERAIPHPSTYSGSRATVIESEISKKKCFFETPCRFLPHVNKRTLSNIRLKNVLKEVKIKKSTVYTGV